MKTISHCAVTNWSSAPDVDIQFCVEAARRELPAFCDAWGIRIPGIQFYSREVELPSNEAIIVSAVDDDGQKGTLGYHTEIAGVPLFLWEVRFGSIVFFHELYETLVNPELARWAEAPNGERWWVEACDATQGDMYPVADVELFGETRTVMSSNWLRPAFFGLPSGDGSTGYDRMGIVQAPFKCRPGGYSVTDGPRGQRQVGDLRPDKGVSTSRTALVLGKLATRL